MSMHYDHKAMRLYYIWPIHKLQEHKGKWYNARSIMVRFIQVTNNYTVTFCLPGNPVLLLKADELVINQRENEHNILVSP